MKITHKKLIFKKISGIQIVAALYKHLLMQLYLFANFTLYHIHIIMVKMSKIHFALSNNPIL